MEYSIIVGIPIGLSFRIRQYTNAPCPIIKALVYKRQSVAHKSSQAAYFQIQSSYSSYLPKSTKVAPVHKDFCPRKSIPRLGNRSSFFVEAFFPETSTKSASSLLKRIDSLIYCRFAHGHAHHAWFRALPDCIASAI